MEGEGRPNRWGNSAEVEWERGVVECQGHPEAHFSHEGGELTPWRMANVHSLLLYARRSVGQGGLGGNEIMI